LDDAIGRVRLSVCLRCCTQGHRRVDLQLAAAFADQHVVVRQQLAASVTPAASPDKSPLSTTGRRLIARLPTVLPSTCNPCSQFVREPARRKAHPHLASALSMKHHENGSNKRSALGTLGDGTDEEIAGPLGSEQPALIELLGHQAMQESPSGEAIAQRLDSDLSPRER